MQKVTNIQFAYDPKFINVTKDASPGACCLFLERFCGGLERGDDLYDGCDGLRYRYDGRERKGLIE